MATMKFGVDAARQACKMVVLIERILAKELKKKERKA